MHVHDVFGTCDSYLDARGVLTDKVLDEDGVDAGVVALCCGDGQLRRCFCVVHTHVLGYRMAVF